MTLVVQKRPLRSLRGPQRQCVASSKVCLRAATLRLERFYGPGAQSRVLDLRRPRSYALHHGATDRHRATLGGRPISRRRHCRPFLKLRLARTVSLAARPCPYQDDSQTTATGTSARAKVGRVDWVVCPDARPCGCLDGGLHHRVQNTAMAPDDFVFPVDGSPYAGASSERGGITLTVETLSGPSHARAPWSITKVDTL